MLVITAKNVDQALPLGLKLLNEKGIERDSRNGKVIAFPTPVTTVYEKPLERVLSWKERDANPFFHFFESLWMLAGRNDVGFLTDYVKTMINYSDDGKTFHGAYGHRWRHHFGFDQLTQVIETLKKDPNSRRCVVQMWDSICDLGNEGKDFPCNTQVVFSINENGALDMSIFNRSNDLIWGAYGANAVHFSFLQEYVAWGVERRVGKYYQISNNLHAYVDIFEKMKPLIEYVRKEDSYTYFNLQPFPLIQTEMKQWDDELKLFLELGSVIAIKDPFFRRVAVPLLEAYKIFKDKSKRPKEVLEATENKLCECQAIDWRGACLGWVRRRSAKLLKANDDGVNYDS